MGACNSKKQTKKFNIKKEKEDLETFEDINKRISTIKTIKSTSKVTKENSNTISELDFAVKRSELVSKIEISEQFFEVQKTKFVEDDTSYELLSLFNNPKVQYLNKIYALHENTEAEVKKHVKVLSTLSHPHIANLKHYDDISVVLDYFPNGNLFEGLTGTKTLFEVDPLEIKPLREAEVACVAYQLVYALKYLHENDVIHRDVCLSNLMVVGKSLKEPEMLDRISGLMDTNVLRIKLTGFEKSCFIGEDSKTIQSTSYYCSPDMLNQNYNEKTDMWSVGVLIYSLLFNEMPFSGETLDELFMNIKVKNVDLRRDKYKHISRDCKTLLNSLFDKSKFRRISAEEALNHPWFEKHRVKEMLYEDTFIEEAEKLTASLLQFYNTNLIEKLLMKKLACSIDFRPEYHLIEDLFVQMDLNLAGTVDFSNFYQGFETFIKREYLNKTSCTNLMEWVGDKKSQNLNLNDFISAFFMEFDFINESQLIFALQMLDLEKNGFLLFEELTKMFEFDEKDRKSINELLLDVFQDAKKGNDKLKLETVFKLIKGKFKVVKNAEDKVKNVVVDLKNSDESEVSARRDSSLIKRKKSVKVNKRTEASKFASTKNMNGIVLRTFSLNKSEPKRRNTSDLRQLSSKDMIVNEDGIKFVSEEGEDCNDLDFDSNHISEENNEDYYFNEDEIGKKVNTDELREEEICEIDEEMVGKWENNDKQGNSEESEGKDKEEQAVGKEEEHSKSADDKEDVNLNHKQDGEEIKQDNKKDFNSKPKVQNVANSGEKKGRLGEAAD